MKYGHLTIYGLKIFVPLYSDDANTQKIVDRPNSAVAIKTPNFLLVADHCNQSNFINIRNAKPLETMAVIRTGSIFKPKIERYICTKMQIGRTIKTDKNRLYDAQNHLVVNRKDIDLCIYTCKTTPNDKGVTEVYLTYWRKVE